MIRPGFQKRVNAIFGPVLPNPTAPSATTGRPEASGRLGSRWTPASRACRIARTISRRRRSRCHPREDKAHASRQGGRHDWCGKQPIRSLPFRTRCPIWGLAKLMRFIGRYSTLPKTLQINNDNASVIPYHPVDGPTRGRDAPVSSSSGRALWHTHTLSETGRNTGSSRWRLSLQVSTAVTWRTRTAPSRLSGRRHQDPDGLRMFDSYGAGPRIHRHSHHIGGR